MLDLLKPVKTESLKDVCIRRLEELILSGKLTVGQKLPPERDLAKQLQVSRPIVHEALVDIAAKGLVSLIPRVGTIVNDFRKEGSIALFTSLIHYHQGKLEPKLLKGLLEMRILFEVENARLAASCRSSEHIETLWDILRREKQTDVEEVELLTQLDFDFHHTIAMASDNLSYPLLLNSFKPIYTNLSRQCFKAPEVASVVHAFHGSLVEAIVERDEQEAMAVMRRMLIHGEACLMAVIAE